MRAKLNAFLRKWQVKVLASGVALLATALLFVRWRALKILNSSAREVAAERELRFTVAQVPTATESRFEWINAPATFSAAAEFEGHLFLAGPGGLYQFGAAGNMEREFRAGRDIPGSPLMRLATGVLADSGQPELLIATADEGLLAFNGTGFRQIRPADPGARQVTAILPLASGHLLIGTAKKGVLVYDGKHLEAFHPTLANLYVTDLAGDNADFWVGTLDRGVLHWHAGETDAFGEEQGLPDPRVFSILANGDRTFVGTPVGVAEFRGGKFDRVVARGAFAESLGLDGRTLLIGTLDQGTIRVPLEARGISPARGASTDDRSEVVQFLDTSDGVFALTRHGLFEMSGSAAGRREVVRLPGAALSEENISALAVDGAGKLYVGYFDRGLDILEPGARKARHIEDQHIFCVNRIVPVRSGEATAVATANGLVMLDREGNERQVLTRADGLIADHVTDIAELPDGLALATPAGITFLGADGPRSLYAFEGLVNNHVYALGVSGRELRAGTLGGISVLDHNQVAVSYTSANSSLDRNWITAIVPIGREWMVGTYGGGVMRQDESGRFHAYDVATAEFDVNPNAMLATPRHVFAGSLGEGLYVYSRATDRWTRITQGLPSQNVTAFALHDGFVYIGTDNGLIRAREQDFEP